MAIAPIPTFVQAANPVTVQQPTPPQAEAVVRVQPTNAPDKGQTGSATADPFDLPYNRPGHQANDQDTLDKALEQLNRSMQAWSTQLRFEQNKDANRLVITIVDAETGEVLKTIPSEAVVRAAKMIANAQNRTIDTQA